MKGLWKDILADVRTWAIIGAAFVVTLGAVGYTLIVWQGDWPAILAGKRLDFLGWALIICLFNVTAIIAALTKRKVSASGPGGISFATGSEDEPPAVVTTTTTSTAVPPTAPATPPARAEQDPDK